MPELSTTMIAPNSPSISSREVLNQLTAAEVAQLLLQKLSITDGDWHRLKANRNARAAELVASALVFLLKDQPKESLPRLQQAVAWLDHSISAPPCEHHRK